MTTRKYIPPHKRRSSANKPPPASTNHSYYTNKKKSSQYQKYSDRTTLTETEAYGMPNQIDTINLDQLLIDKQKWRQISIHILSKYSQKDIAKLIFEFCNDLLVLIPNTFERDELLKYWFVIGKGPLINEYRKFQRVNLNSDSLQFTRRGGIASIKGYKPSKTAKLKLVCKFIYRHPKDGLAFSFRTNGHRDAIYKGDTYTEGALVKVNGSLGQFGNSKHSNEVQIIQKDEAFTIEKRMKTSVQLMNNELKMIIVDDGQKMKITYIDHENKSYSMECNSTSVSNPIGLYRVALYNRRDPGRVSDITYLQLSIVTTNE